MPRPRVRMPKIQPGSTRHLQRLVRQVLHVQRPVFSAEDRDVLAGVLLQACQAQLQRRKAERNKGEEAHE